MDIDDIYGDLDKYTLDQQVEQVQEVNKELLQTIEKLEETTRKFQEEISELKKINHNLETNISVLYKTAKVEIERKDRQIAELRRDLDNVKFRRGNNGKTENLQNNASLAKENERSISIIEQKNRIIHSLTKDLENVKKKVSNQENELKRKSSQIEDEHDLRNMIAKKRKLEQKLDDIQKEKSDCDYKSHSKSRNGGRSRSRSKSINAHRNDSYKGRANLKSQLDNTRLNFQRNRSGSYNRRRASNVDKHNQFRKNSRYSRSRSRSRSPPFNKKYNNRVNDQEVGRTNKSSRVNMPSVNNKIITKLKSRSRSSSIDEKKYHKHNSETSSTLDTNNLSMKNQNNPNCDIKNVLNLLKEDSGSSSSKSHTSELILKHDEIEPKAVIPIDIVNDIKINSNELEDGEIDCTVENIHSDKDQSLFKVNAQKTSKHLFESNVKTTANKLIKNVPKENVLVDSADLLKNKPISHANKNEGTTKQIVNNVEKSRTCDEQDDLICEPKNTIEITVKTDPLNIENEDEFIIDKRKKRKEDKERISILKSAISECKQNIQKLEHTIHSQDESETEDDFNKTETKEGITNPQQNNLVFKIVKGSIVKPSVAPKILHPKHDVNQGSAITSEQNSKADCTFSNSKIDKRASIENTAVSGSLITTNKNEKSSSENEKNLINDKNKLNCLSTIETEILEPTFVNTEVVNVQKSEIFNSVNETKSEKYANSQMITKSTNENLESVTSIANKYKHAVNNNEITKNIIENKITILETQKKPNLTIENCTSVEQSIAINKNEAVISETHEIIRKPPLKARRRRAYISIT